MSNIRITHHLNYSKITFDAMANQCEVLVRSVDSQFCHQIAEMAFKETRRIESIYSRYIKGNLVDQMNNSGGHSINIDIETFKLLEYARNLFELSEGLFDITSGVLRKIWKFTADAQPPTAPQIEKLLNKIGFDKIEYNQHQFKMPQGMQLDFGGIGKEYAVDQVTQKILLLCSDQKASFLVNFGGDLSAKQIVAKDPDWVVGIESTDHHDITASIIRIAEGSVATSGNSKRFFEHQGKRYGHLLNPKTGKPICGSPLSITTFSKNCVLAGSFSSLAMLQGAQAEDFLKEQQIKYICLW